MRRLTSIIGLISIALAMQSSNDAAARRVRDCPTVSVLCPDTPSANNRMTFTAAVANFDTNSKLTYTWAISAGTIVSGQGTSSIVVDMTDSLGGLTATIDVGGLTEACPSSSSCTIFICPLPQSRQIGEYGKFLGDEKAQLNNFTIELQNDPTTQGYLICYGGRRDKSGGAEAQCRRALSYLTETRSIDALRIVTVDGGYKEKLNVELWLVPSGAIPPSASPTVDPREVRIIKSRARGRTYRR
jgi:hypothetical protein